MKVYELTNGSGWSGHRVGLFISVEAAQAYAQRKLDEYHAAEWATDEDTETLTTTTLEWSMQAPRDFLKPVLTAVYGLENGSAFRINEHEVQE